ncbi:hypothetical protein TSTA_085500 [Talaromyces stipitatus ATCC 10500]|uniref:Uncharacterized protein n=1 Tax=Talaromyces stipitatus (strain ATCC 10500 / CBS 375.48 / QM 6759 / NRRL 1006) TaxID=441959 RepID=B8M1U1_TALSN|nr:uncharacterized protein TSTA_085500 [Talaromyces stipitatus ATCC 10500]EED21319.1 hypothetical protein TSTA_085500 [Talaromyces stipitatus ATCC 10500]
MEMPPFRSTPIAGFTRTQPVLSWAFPTLFPRGEAEFILPRQHSVKFDDYIKHLMRFDNGPGGQEVTADQLRAAFEDDNPEGEH